MTLVAFAIKQAHGLQYALAIQKPQAVVSSVMMVLLPQENLYLISLPATIVLTVTTQRDGKMPNSAMAQYLTTVNHAITALLQQASTHHILLLIALVIIATKQQAGKALNLGMALFPVTASLATTVYLLKENPVDI